MTKPGGNTKNLLTDKQALFLDFHNPSMVHKALRDNGISNYRKLRMFDDADTTLPTLHECLQKSGLDRDDILNIKILRQWLDENRNKGLIDLDETTWYNYLDNEYKLPDANSKPTSMPTATRTDTTPFKVATRDIVKLSKSNVEDNFPEWYQAFIGQVKLAGCGKLTEESFKPPKKNDSNYQEFLKQDEWLLTCINHATMGTTAYPNIDPDGSGWMNLQILCAAYYGDAFKKDNSREANKELGTLYFNERSTMSPAGFVAKYQTLLRRLHQGGSGYPPSLARDTFLTKITHPTLGAWKEVISYADESVYPLSNLYTLFRNKCRELNIGSESSSEVKSDSTNHSSFMTNQGNASNSLTEKDKAIMKKAIKEQGRLPNEIFQKLNRKQRHTFIADKRKERNMQHQPSNHSLPSQYSAKNANVIRGNDGHYYAIMDDTQPMGSSNQQATVHQATYAETAASTNTSTTASTNNANNTVPDNKQRALRMMRLQTNSNNVKFQVSNLRVRLSAQVSHQMSLQDHQLNSTGVTYVDGGTNISAMGKQFHITERSTRHVDMEGFANDLTKTNIPIGNGLTVVENEHGHRVLMGLREAPILSSNKHSLISSGQAREARTWVGDTLLRHGGDQTLAQQQEDGSEWRAHLNIFDGLLGLQCRYPTPTELETLPRVWLTNDDVPWEPSLLADTTTEVLPMYGPYDHSRLHTNMAQILEYSPNHLAEVHSFDQTQLRHRNQLPHLQAFTNFIGANALGLAWVATCLHSIFLGRSETRPLDPNQHRGHLGWLPLDTIQRTFDATTQLAQAIGDRLPMRRHCKSRTPQLNCRRLAETFATDTLFSDTAAWGGNKCAQLFCGTTSLYTAVYGMHTESNGPTALDSFCRDHGAPSSIRNDNSKMQTGSLWNKIMSKYVIKAELTEPYHKQQNPAESRIGVVKRMTNKILDRTGAPIKAWFLCMLYVVTVLNHTATSSLGWRTPIERCFGFTPDISHLLLYDFWEPVFFLDIHQDTGKTQCPHSDERFGYWAGPATNVGDTLCFWIVLPDGGTTLARSVLRSARDTANPNLRAAAAATTGSSVTTEDRGDQSAAEDRGERGDDQSAAEDRGERGDTLNLDLLSELLDAPSQREPIDITTLETMVGESFVRIDQRGIPSKTTTVECDEETGKILLEYAHGGQEWVEPNIVQEALLSREDEAQNLWSFKRVLAHRKNGNRIEVQLEWDNGDVTWEPLNVTRKDDPVTIAKYALDNNLTNERGWTWTKSITKNPKKLLRMLKIMKGQQKQPSSQKKATTSKYKFGYEVPPQGRYDIAKLLDTKAKNNKWGESIKLEIDNLWQWETFEEFDPNTASDIDQYQFVNLLMCFDVKFDGRHKSRLVANGARTADLDDSIYSGVVSIRAVRLLLFLAQLNDLEVCAADVSQAYLYSDCMEKIYTKAGPEFGPEWEGKYLRINKALYGLKSSAAAYHVHLSNVLYNLNFIPSKADSDLWIKDCGTHYEYIATWVDDLLIASKDASYIIQQLKETYELKGVGIPEYYLGGDVENTIVNNKRVLATSAKTYIRQLVGKCEDLMQWKLRSYNSPEHSDYHPELDESPFLDTDQHAKYRMMVGSLNWCVTLGRWDVQHAASTYARYAQAPRQGHMTAMERIFGYLKHHAKRRTVYDVSMPDFSNYKLPSYDWFRRYPNASEELDENMPEPKGMPVRIAGYFDASHASCLQTRRSVTGVLLFLNNTPIESVSKRQGTVESSTYGSEIVAGRIAVDHVVGLLHDLRWLGVPIEGPAILFGDNEAMVKNVSLPSSTLKKRHNSIAYHRCREAIAAGVVAIIHCPTDANLSDALTKPLGPILFERLTHPSRTWPSPKDVENGELQDLNSNKSIVQLNKDPTHSIDLDSLHEGDFGAALANKTFVSYMKTFHYKTKRSFPHD